MTRKRLITGITLVGFILALGGNAWAGQDKGGNRHQAKGLYQQTAKTPPGHHTGWGKGKKNPHKTVYRHYPAYPPRDHHRRPVGVEKHVYHHYRSQAPQDDGQFKVAVSLIENAFSIAVAVNRTY